MDEMGIRTSPSERGKAERTLVDIRFETTLGARYDFPDMTREQEQQLLKQLHLQSEKVVALNISGSTLIIPYRILRGLYRRYSKKDWPEGVLEELWAR